MAQDHTFPADQDTNDAANFAQFLGRGNLTDYVEVGFGFTPDYTVPEVTIDAGKAFVRASSMYADKAAVTRDQGVDILAQKTQTTVGLSDNAVNYIYIDANLDLTDTSSTDDQPQFVAKTTDSAPSDESIKIGEVDTSNDTYTLFNREPDATFNRLVASTLDAQVETAAVSGNYTTSGESIIFVDSSGGAITITLASSDVVDGNSIAVVDYGGAAATNNITIATEGSETIDGASSDEITSDYGAFEVASDGSNWYSSGGGSASASISQDGTQILPSPTDINFSDLTVTDDGDNTVTIAYDDVSTTRVWRGEDGVMSGLTLESSDSMTIPSDYSMVVGEQYTVDGTLTVDGNLTVVDNEDEKPPVLDSTTATLTDGATPALDTTYTTSITDASKAIDVIVSPQNSSFSFNFEYNYDVSIGYDGTNVTVGVTANWDTEPGGGNDVGVDIEIYNRER